MSDLMPIDWSQLLSEPSQRRNNHPTTFNDLRAPYHSNDHMPMFPLNDKSQTKSKCSTPTQKVNVTSSTYSPKNQCCSKKKGLRVQCYRYQPQPQETSNDDKDGSMNVSDRKSVESSPDFSYEYFPANSICLSEIENSLRVQRSEIPSVSIPSPSNSNPIIYPCIETTPTEQTSNFFRRIIDKLYFVLFSLFWKLFRFQLVSNENSSISEDSDSDILNYIYEEIEDIREEDSADEYHDVENVENKENIRIRKLMDNEIKKEENEDAKSILDTTIIPNYISSSSGTDESIILLEEREFKKTSLKRKRRLLNPKKKKMDWKILAYDSIIQSQESRKNTQEEADPLEHFVFSKGKIVKTLNFPNYVAETPNFRFNAKYR